MKHNFSKPIKVFRYDNAQEYKAHEFTSILHQFCIVLNSSCAGTSQQNGRAEPKLRHILDVVHATTIAASTPSQFWGETALTSVYTINRCPSPIVHNQTPYDLLFGSSPSYDLLRVFGCVCFVLLQDHERNKLQSRSRLCCFLRYGIGQKGYRCYDPIRKRLRVSRHVVFWEHKMFYQLPHVPVSLIPSIDPLPDLFPEESPTSLSESPPSITNVPSHTFDELPASIIDVPTDTAPIVDPASLSDSHALRRSHRVTTLPSHLRDFHCFFALASLQEPQTFHEAFSNPLWQQAMKEELDALHKTGNGIWLISPLENLLSIVNGFIRSRLDRMALLIATRLTLLPGVLLRRSMGLIMRRLLLLWLDFLLSRLLLTFLRLANGHFFIWMSKMLFLMVNSQRKSI